MTPPTPIENNPRPRSIAERIRDLAAEGSPVVVEALAQAIPAGPGVRLVPAVTVQPELVDWAWAGRIPVGMLGLLVGEGGLGKSLLGCYLAAGFSRGSIPGDFEGQPVDVAIASSEDHRAAVIVPRLIAAGADLTRIYFVEQVDDEGVASDIDIEGTVDRIEAALIEPRVRFLLIDTVVSHVPSEHDSHKEQHVRRVLAPLARMAERQGIAVLGTMHLNRRENRNVLTRIMGSGGFGNLARSVLVVGLDPQEAPDSTVRLLAHGKCNVGRLAPTLRMRVDTTETSTGGRVYSEARVELLGGFRASMRPTFCQPRTPARRNAAPARKPRSSCGTLWPTGHAPSKRSGGKPSASATRRSGEPARTWV
jgi:AAA domain